MEKLEGLVRTMTDAPLTMDQRIALIQSLALAEIAKSLNSIIGEAQNNMVVNWLRILRY